jgi:outer membrane lipoprotein SlyB
MVKLLLVIATMISLSVFGCATTDQRLEGGGG